MRLSKNMNSRLSIGTLGPKGTSSEYSAQHYINKFLPYDLPTEIKLYNHFNLVLHSLLMDQVGIAIVPHAYDKINEFYINPEFSLVQNYEYNTPEYGLYKLAGSKLSGSNCNIVSHPAPVNLIKYLLEHNLPEIVDYTVTFVDSTVIAANLVKTGSATLALTNKKAAEQNSLELVAMYGEIQMGWSVFTKRKA